jgi:hypothetical protein
MDAGLLGHLHEMWRQIFAGWQFAYIVVPLGFLAAAATCRRIAGRFMLTVLLIQLIIWAGFTHLLPRFFVPAVPFAAAAVGLSLRGRPPWAGASVMAAAVILGLIALLPTVSRELQNETVKFLFDFKDLARLEPDVLSTLERGNYKVALIGDAQAFLDQASRDHLLYRSVFDVNIPPGQNVVDGWLGPGHTVEQLRRDGYIVIINTSELNRLSKTYRGIPPVPPQWQRPNFEPIILPPD